LFSMVPKLLMVIPESMVSVTPGSIVHISVVPIVSSDIIVLEVVKCLEAASACWTGSEIKRAIAPIPKAIAANSIIRGSFVIASD